ncbi:hypothetical protein J2847_003084 [Azospirillum agricola]|uniref:hypothetical protein n=1 Tax=Azospirillum agricola TaxID=1720247 RepID=UPI001AE494B2|nr:hypothetical protein [Azospirillum agricola]MBP2229785.1 hypothetical protein [Azospirillum agricola]
MGSFQVEVLDWGLRLRLQGALSVGQRDTLIRRVEHECAAYALQKRAWTSLIEFDHFQAEGGFRPELLVGLMRLARTCGHQRCAILLSDWQWASVLADAMIEAGTDDQVRIFVQPDGFEADCGSAMAWVLHGGVIPLVSRAA